MFWLGWWEIGTTDKYTYIYTRIYVFHMEEMFFKCEHPFKVEM